MALLLAATQHCPVPLPLPNSAACICHTRAVILSYLTADPLDNSDLAGRGKADIIQVATERSASGRCAAEC